MAGVVIAGVGAASLLGGVWPQQTSRASGFASVIPDPGGSPASSFLELSLPAPQSMRQSQAATAAHVALTGVGRQLVDFRTAAEVVARTVAQRKAADEAAAAQAAAAQQAAAQQAAAEQAAAAQRAAADDAAAAPRAYAAAPAPAATVDPPAARRAASTPTATTPAPATTAAPSPPPPPAPSPAAASVAVDVSAESRFVALLNDARAQAGLAPLALNGSLRASAEGWAAQLANDGTLHHQNVSQFLASWSTAGENIAFGPSVDSMFKALMASPQHYANIMKPDFTAVGVGVVLGADGKLWTSHVFAG